MSEPADPTAHPAQQGHEQGGQRGPGQTGQTGQRGPGQTGHGRWEAGAAELGRRLYLVMNCLVAPRPIAWISTVDAGGVANLAPHSFFTVASADPPLVQFTSIGRKDSLRNAEATGEFVVNVVPWRLRLAVNETSIDAPPYIDEFSLADLTPEPSAAVRPPRVAQSPGALECRLVAVHSYGDRPASGHVVVGQVVHVAVDAGAMAADGLPDLRVLDSATRGDRMNWYRMGEGESIERPRWADRS